MAIKKPFTLCAVLIFACTMMPVAAHANGVTVTINDLHDVVTGTAVGLDPTSVLIRGGLEAWDMHGEWISVSPPPVGVSIVVNINFLEPYNDDGIPVGGLSDSLNMVFTGISPFPGDLDNVSVDLHFRSDPYAVWLPNAYSIYENGLYQDVSHFVVLRGGPTDFTIAVASDTPEPSSLLLLGSGTLGLAGLLRRRLGR